MFGLFFLFLKIGLFTFGGGSAVAPIIKREVVDKKGYITDEEFMDILVTANMLPGPSMAQMAALVGRKLHGIKGAIIASFAIIMPITIAFSLLATLVINIVDVELLVEYSRPAIVVICASLLVLIIDIYSKVKDKLHIIVLLLFALSTALLIIIFGIHPSIIIVLTFIGVFIYGTITAST